MLIVILCMSYKNNINMKECLIKLSKQLEPAVDNTFNKVLENKRRNVKMATKAKATYNSLKKLFLVYERTGVCAFHYYPENSEYATLARSTVDEIFGELCENGVELVRHDGRLFVVRNIEVTSECGAPLVGFIQISPPKILKL